jgi:hypothetical protein
MCPRYNIYGLCLPNRGNKWCPGLLGGCMIHSKGIFHSLDGWKCAHSGHAAKVRAKWVTIAPISGKQGILALYHPLWSPLAYLAPTTGIVATPMSCNRVHTPYVHLLATFAWFADLCCRFGSQKMLKKGQKPGFWPFFPLLGGL